MSRRPASHGTLEQLSGRACRIKRWQTIDLETNIAGAVFFQCELCRKRWEGNERVHVSELFNCQARQKYTIPVTKRVRK